MTECIRFFGIDDFEEMRKMTLYEYRIRIEAHRLTSLELERNMHWQAWLNWNVQATKKQGSKIVPVFRKFRDFFDYEKLLNGSDEAAGEKQRLKEAYKKQKERGMREGKL